MFIGVCMLLVSDQYNFHQQYKRCTLRFVLQAPDVIYSMIASQGSIVHAYWVSHTSRYGKLLLIQTTRSDGFLIQNDNQSVFNLWRKQKLIEFGVAVFEICLNVARRMSRLSFYMDIHYAMGNKTCFTFLVISPSYNTKKVQICLQPALSTRLVNSRVLQGYLPGGFSRSLS